MTPRRGRPLPLAPGTPGQVRDASAIAGAEALAQGDAEGAPERRSVPREGPMTDGFGRRIEYLRISVTDKCNLRCVYCMPLEGMEWLRRDELLSFEEITRIVEAMAPLGLRRVRLTGGEPLVRRDLPELVARLSAIPGIDDLSLSTNAVLLEEHAEALRDAGLNRVNVSLDSLDPERVDRIARRPGSYERIMRGLEAAERFGFRPLKINVVLMEGMNDDEIPAFAELTRDRPWHVRFIEIMPTGANLALSEHRYLSCDEALARVRRLGRIEPVEGPTGNGPATYYRYPGAAGTIGVITPMSHNFCDRCNRMRLTAEGQLRPCLFGDLQTDLRAALRSGQPLEPLIRDTLAVKPERHWLERGNTRGSGGLVALSQTGG
jgi:cyclic pyranopterin phosphate synthase